jgi:hypothetical protein
MSYIIEYQDQFGRRKRAVVEAHPHMFLKKEDEIRADGGKIISLKVV